MRAFATVLIVAYVKLADLARVGFEPAQQRAQRGRENPSDLAAGALWPPVAKYAPDEGDDHKNESQKHNNYSYSN